MRNLMIIYAIFLINFGQGFSQGKDQIPQLDYKGQPFYRFLAKNLKYPNELKTCDRISVLAAIKFKLDAKGKVVFVEAVGNIGDTTRSHLRDIILKSDGYWKPQMRNGKPVASNLIVQPILFKLEDGCEGNILFGYEGFNKSIREVFEVETGNEICIMFGQITVLGGLRPMRKAE